MATALTGRREGRRCRQRASSSASLRVRRSCHESGGPLTGCQPVFARLSARARLDAGYLVRVDFETGVCGFVDIDECDSYLDRGLVRITLRKGALGRWPAVKRIPCLSNDLTAEFGGERVLPAIYR